MNDNKAVLLGRKYWAYLAAILLIGVMVGLAELTGQKEIIFPEITALAVGAWVAPHQPWKVDRLRLWFLVCLVAVCGVLIVRYVHIAQVLQLCLGVAVAGLLLTISKTSIFPIISACALPILLQTETWIYPLSVAVFALCIVGGQYLAERLKLHEEVTFQPVQEAGSLSCCLWLKRIVLIFLVAAIPLHFGWAFCVAPPLLVAFTELTNSGSPARRRAKDVIILTVLCAVIGVACRFLAETVFWLPLTAAAGLAVLLVLLLMRRMKLFLPPSGAIGTLPMLIEPQFLLAYPLEILVGITVLVMVAIYCFPVKEKAAAVMNTAAVPQEIIRLQGTENVYIDRRDK